MTKFNKLFNTSTTSVLMYGDDVYRRVIEIHPSRKLIKIDGVGGSLQRAHVKKFTNKQ